MATFFAPGGTQRQPASGGGYMPNLPLDWPPPHDPPPPGMPPITPDPGVQEPVPPASNPPAEPGPGPAMPPVTPGVVGPGSSLTPEATPTALEPFRSLNFMSNRFVGGPGGEQPAGLQFGPGAPLSGSSYSNPTEALRALLAQLGGTGGGGGSQGPVR